MYHLLACLYILLHPATTYLLLHSPAFCLLHCSLPFAAVVLLPGTMLRWCLPAAGRRRRAAAWAAAHDADGTGRVAFA